MSQQLESPAARIKQRKAERVRRLHEVINSKAGGNQSEFARNVWPNQWKNYTGLVSRWLSGEREPNLEQYERIADYAEQSIDWLLARHGAAPAEQAELGLAAARRQLLLALFDQVTSSDEYRNLTESGGVHYHECLAAGFAAASDALSTPKLRKLYFEGFRAAFQGMGRYFDAQELGMWRHASRRRGRVPWQPGDLWRHLRMRDKEPSKTNR